MTKHQAVLAAIKHFDKLAEETGSELSYEVAQTLKKVLWDYKTIRAGDKILQKGE